MHPKAAYLALNGFLPFVREPITPERIRVKRQEEDDESILRFRDGVWIRSSGDELYRYELTRWDVLSDEQWDALPQKLLDEFVQEA